MLIKTMGGYGEGTVGTLLTYKDGHQALHLHLMVYGPWKVEPGDMGRKFQRTDYGVALPIRKPPVTDQKPVGLFRRLLTPKGKVSVYWQAITADSLSQAGVALEEKCREYGWLALLKRGYSWEPATLIFKNTKGKCHV